MRDVERLLIVVNFAGALVQGFRHDPSWFLVSLSGFALYVMLADRELRRRIGPRAWPSEGYARFAFNTNLYFAVRHLLLGGLLFSVAGAASGLAGL